MHKKNWSKKIIPARRSIHSKAATSAKICQNSSKNIRLTGGFHWKSKSLIKYRTFRFSMETPSKIYIFWRVLSDFWSSALRLSELIFKVECCFCSSFFCATRYTLVVYRKNCLGDLAKVFNSENSIYKISLQIFPNLASTYLESVISSCTSV